MKLLPSSERVPRTDRAHPEGTPVYVATSANFSAQYRIPETLIPEGSKSRVSGDGLESNYTENAGLWYWSQRDFLAVTIG